MPKIVCVIPARLNSRRFPRKMLHSIGRKSLLQTTVENVQSFSFFSEIFVATDSLEIAKHVENRVPVIITSSAPRSGTDRIAEALRSSYHLQDAEIIMNMQGDHPFVSLATTKKIIQSLVENPNTQIATAVRPCSYEQAKPPQTVKCTFDHNHNALYFSRSVIPYNAKTYYHHIGLYAYRRAFLQKLSSLKPSDIEIAEDLEQLRFLSHGYQIKVAVTTSHPDTLGDMIGIDTPDQALAYKHLFFSETPS
ncbi:MAG: 3-deoxy-manno-octulosonate cytidylyltransferase [Chlamydiota bacterium]